MVLEPLGIQGAWLAESPLRKDERGFFREWFKASDIQNLTGFEFSVAQGNISHSAKGVVRGIHYSISLDGQAKWVTCTSGSIMDFIVDLRVGSPTFKKTVAIPLSENDGSAVLVGNGLGHAFLSLSDDTKVTYLLTSDYSPKDEFGINPFDDELEIDWQGFLGSTSVKLIVSPKDLIAPSLLEQRRRNLLPKQ